MTFDDFINLCVIPDECRDDAKIQDAMRLCWETSYHQGVQGAVNVYRDAAARGHINDI